MDADELNVPLGTDKDKDKPKAPIIPQMLAGVLGLFGLTVVGWALFVNNPLGGEPVAVVAVSTEPASAKADDPGAEHHSHHDGPVVATLDAPGAPKTDNKTAAKTDAPPDGKTITIIDGSSGKQLNVVVPDRERPVAAPPDKRLLERTAQGAIPKIAPDGTKAFALYARPRTLPVNRSDAPRIAIIVGGLGISATSTADALSRLPSPVTFAVAPYGVDLEKLASAARARGHELLLQVPMEPFDYPNNDPGPRTLLTSLSADQNIERLHWLMARFQGYVGLIGYMGAKFTATEPALTPVLHDAGARGLIFVDDGSSPRSMAGSLAGTGNVPFAKADIVLDAVPTPAEIDHALARLEMMAKERGFAVAYASAQPAAIARIAEWAKAVEQRGFVLVPITMVAVKSKST